MDKLILVLYVPNILISKPEFKQGIHDTKQKMGNEYELFVIPTQKRESWMECINPKFIENKTIWDVTLNKIRKIEEYLLPLTYEQQSDSTQLELLFEDDPTIAGYTVYIMSENRLIRKIIDKQLLNDFKQEFNEIIPTEEQFNNWLNKKL